MMTSTLLISRSKNFIIDWTGSDYKIPDGFVGNNSYLAIDHEGQMCVFSSEPKYDGECWFTQEGGDSWDTLIYTINELPKHENYETSDACWKIPNVVRSFSLKFAEDEKTPSESLPTYKSYQHITLKEAFELFAKGIEVQFEYENDLWPNLQLDTPFVKIHNTRFRVGKLKETVTINGLQVPVPVKEPKLKAFYWFIESHELKGVKGKYILTDYELKSLCWETKEEAMIAFEAFNSFFK